MKHWVEPEAPRHGRLFELIRQSNQAAKTQNRPVSQKDAPAQQEVLRRLQLLALASLKQ